MGFSWLILMLIFIILFGSDRGHWGDIWGGDNNYIFGNRSLDWPTRKTDFELRLEARKHIEGDVVMVSADDHIPKTDQHLERLISEGRIDEAREYRQGMEKIADEMDDDQGMRKYAIYGARIARKAKAVAMEERKKRLESSMEIPVKQEHKPIFATGVGTVPVIGSTLTQSVTPSTVPPLWKAKKTPESVAQKKEFIPPKPPKDDVKPIISERERKIEIEEFRKKDAQKKLEKEPKQRIEFYKPLEPSKDKPKFISPSATKQQKKPVETIPEPPKSVYEKPKSIMYETEPVKPESPTIQKDFTPPPSGPVTLGVPGPADLSDERSGYISGPVDIDAKLAGTDNEKNLEAEKEKLKKESEEKISPDDYEDLISL